MRTNAALLLLFLQAGTAYSVVVAGDWKGASGGAWNTAANWVGGAPPVAVGDSATFGSSGGGGTVSLDGVNGAVVISSLTFNLATSYTISPAVAQFLTLDVTSGSASITSTTGAHTIATAITLSDPLAVSQNSSGTLTISGLISGPLQSLTLSGSGTLALTNGSNTYSGGTTITSGTLSITAEGDLGNASGAVSIGTGTLLYGGNVTSNRTYTLTGAATINTGGFDVSLSPTTGGISGGGSLTKVGAGILTLTTSNSYQGGTIISAGELDISNDNQLGNTSGTLTIGTATLKTTSSITSARSGSFTGNTSTINTSGNTDTFTGTFSGTGGLTISGGGTVILNPASGSNSYSGGTILTGAGTTLTGNTSGIQGSITLGGATALTFSQTSSGNYAGAISGSGTLTKSGAGTVTFSGNSSSFSGPTNITAGTLTVNGSLSGSSLVTVSTGATLSGSGTVGPTTSAGTIDPGNGTSVGTLSVNGALTLNPPSTVNISIAPLSADKMAVTGTANLNSTSLVIEPTSGFYGFSSSYTILTSTLLNGTFAPPISTHSAFAPSIISVGNNILLTVAITQPFALFSFSNKNTQAVGKNIDALSAAGQLPSDLISVVNTFIGKSNTVINQALDQMHPAPYSAFTELQAEANGQLLSLFHRLPYLPSCCKDPNRFWLETFGNSLTMKHHGIEFGFQGNTVGAALGYDGEVKDNLILGIGAAWNRGWLEWHDHHGHGEYDGFYGGLYLDWQIDQFYLGGAILGGADLYDTDRHIEFTTINRHAKADPFALDFMAQFATAYLFGAPYAFFYPYANIDFLLLHTYEFQEHGADSLNLTVRSRTDSTLRSEMGLGLQVQDLNMDETICISPQVSIGWVNMCPLERKPYSSTFQGASIPFSTYGWDQNWNLFNVDFGLTLAIDCFTLALQYNVDLSPNHDTTLFNQHGNIRLDWKW